MFGCAFLFLVGLAVLVTHQIDMPTVGERTGLQDVQADQDTEVSPFVSGVGWILLILWPVFLRRRSICGSRVLGVATLDLTIGTP
jgi:hypothetical protein